MVCSRYVRVSHHGLTFVPFATGISIAKPSPTNTSPQENFAVLEGSLRPSLTHNHANNRRERDEENRIERLEIAGAEHAPKAGNPSGACSCFAPRTGSETIPPARTPTRTAADAMNSTRIAQKRPRSAGE